MNVREKAVAARVARQRIIAGIPGSDDIITGTVQPNEGGGAWVHCMVFVPAVDIEEHVITSLLSQRRALVADLRSCGSDRLTRATIEAQIKMIDLKLAEARNRRES